MLYYLFLYLENQFDVPGAGVFQFITFRTAMAVIFSLGISMLIGKYIIRWLQRYQVGEEVRELGLTGEEQKQGTPTMGGIIILAAILIPTLLFAKLSNVYIIVLLATTVWLGILGFFDDYIKVFRQEKAGLAGKFKIIGQIMLGFVIGSIIFFHDDVVVRKQLNQETSNQQWVEQSAPQNGETVTRDVKAPVTTIPFVKNNEFDYSVLLGFLGNNAHKWVFLIFIPIVIFIITAVSNGANITDGLDGLATGTSAIIASTLGIFAYVSGNIILADYLNIMYIPNSGEMVIYSGAFIGACIGFLWYNAYPAQVFMGDTGSLALGGIIASQAILVRKELLIPLLCGVFLIENVSVMMQVAYFKYTRKKYGKGKRIFLMAPLHHHYQKKGIHESKIVTRFWIVGIVLAVLTVVTLKLR
jgi:phospho-N-acetylmuramoyl-pentapeptide-transferase